MTYNYRCTAKKCRRRRTLRKRKEEYKTEPKCLHCGGNLADRTNYERTRTKTRNCYCDGLWFSMKGSPHSLGSKGCRHYQGTYTDEELEESYYSR